MRLTDFSDRPLSRRPKSLASAFIDSRTIRSASGIDYHTRQILDSFLLDSERVRVAIEHRRSRHIVTTGVLSEVSARMAQEGQGPQQGILSLAMDQSSRAAWEADVIPHVSDIPFGMSGQGRQAAVKVELAIHRTADLAKYVLIEEPETHQSHSSLWSLLDRIQDLAGPSQQVFITTHSSLVLNRLGLDHLLLLSSSGNTVRISDLTLDTVRYFQRLSGYDTLRLVLASKLVLVEGPSDEMIFERCFSDQTGISTRAAGVDVLAMSGVSFGRAYELCARLGRGVVGIRDNDGVEPSVHLAALDGCLSDDRIMMIGQVNDGRTLEPQLITANDETVLRSVLGVRPQDNLETWMRNHKTEGALRILESLQSISYPEYVLEAVRRVSE